MTAQIRRHNGSGLVDPSEAEQMLRSGQTQAEVADRFGVTQSAIAHAIERGAIKVPPKHLRAIPWVVKPEHRNLAIPRMLRIANRILNGEEVGPSLRRQGEGFIRRLREEGAVIHYDPEGAIDPGTGERVFFFRVPARAGIDNGLVREPDE